jgi:hypothetical protein
MAGLVPAISFRWARRHISAFTHSPSKTGVNALVFFAALCAGHDG